MDTKEFRKAVTSIIPWIGVIGIIIALRIPTGDLKDFAIAITHAIDNWLDWILLAGNIIFAALLYVNKNTIQRLKSENDRIGKEKSKLQQLLIPGLSSSSAPTPPPSLEP